MAALSLNLAVVNLLPIPILDGATILMLLIEMFMRRDLSLRVKEAALRLGFVFLDGDSRVRALQRYFQTGRLNAPSRSRSPKRAGSELVIRRHKHRLNIHRNTAQSLQRLLHVGPNHAQLIQHLLGARIIARGFERQQVMIQIANRAA